MSDSNTIRAEIVRTLHNAGMYRPKAMPMQGLMNACAVSSGERGKVRNLAGDMADDVTEPVVWKDRGKSVMLDGDEDSIRRSIERNDAEKLPTSLDDEIRVI